METVYTILSKMEPDVIVSEKELSRLINYFQNKYLSEIKYYERLEQHRNPIEVQNGTLRDIDNYLQQIQNREEMIDIDPDQNCQGHVPTFITNIWRSDKRIKSLYNAVVKYCNLRSKDFNIIAVHIAEYRAIRKLFYKIKLSISKSAIILAEINPASGIITRTIHSLPFNNLSGKDFERLVYAYVRKEKNWTNYLEWLGENGNDGGQDIWGEINGETFCYQCANHKRVYFSKISKDIQKLIVKNTLPDNFILVAGGPVSSKMRKKIKNFGNEVGILKVKVWSGSEFEERLREHSTELIWRFFGNIF